MSGCLNLCRVSRLAQIPLFHTPRKCMIRRAAQVLVVTTRYNIRCFIRCDIFSSGKLHFSMSKSRSLSTHPLTNFNSPDLRAPRCRKSPSRMEELNFSLKAFFILLVHHAKISCSVTWRGHGVTGLRLAQLRRSQIRPDNHE